MGENGAYEIAVFGGFVMECKAFYSEEFPFGQCENCGAELNSYELYEVETCPECGAHIIGLYDK